MSKLWLRWLVGCLVLLVITIYGFTFILDEGNIAVVTRFGAPRAELTEAGLYWKIPWPFEKVFILDGRRQFLDSSFSESLTRDKRNVILQTYLVWSIAQPLKFLQSTGGREIAELHLNSLITNAKNGILGKYEISALVSTDQDELKIAEIEQEIQKDIENLAEERYGVKIHQVGLKRFGFPEANLGAVLEQMRTERYQFATRYRAEGQLNANQIRNETDVLVAQLRAEGIEEAAKIRGATEAEVSKIYAEAYAENSELFTFLRRLESMNNILGENSTLIFRADSSPFNVLNEHFKEGK